MNLKFKLVTMESDLKKLLNSRKACRGYMISKYQIQLLSFDSPVLANMYRLI